MIGVTKELIRGMCLKCIHLQMVDPCAVTSEAGEEMAVPTWVCAHGKQIQDMSPFGLRNPDCDKYGNLLCDNAGNGAACATGDVVRVPHGTCGGAARLCAKCAEAEAPAKAPESQKPVKRVRIFKNLKRESAVDRWEWRRGAGLKCIYRDGTICKSEYTLRELLNRKSNKEYYKEMELAF